MRVGGILTALLVTTSLATHARAQDDVGSGSSGARTIARIVATSGVGGSLGRPVCDEEHVLRDTPFATLTPRLTQLADDPARPLVFDTGSLLTPGALARFSASQEPDRLAELVASLGYRALIFGPNELAAVRQSMLQAFRSLRERGIPAIASNLFCVPEGPAVELCEILVDGSDGPSIHLVHGRRVALVSVMPNDTLEALAPNLAEGLRATTPLVGMTSAVRRARAAGAELVFAVLDHGANVTDASRKVIELATNLPEDARPDVLFAPGAGTQLVFARPPGVVPAIVAAPPGGALDVRIREDPNTPVYDILARPVVPSVRIAPVFARWTAEVGRRYCERWGRELAGGHLDEPMTGRGLLELAAAVMRARSATEIAIVDQGVLSRHWRAPDEGALTGSDVYVGLQYDEQVVVAHVPASWVEKVAKKLADDYLVVPGLAWDGSRATVNGRPLELRGEYRVSTLHFLAAGGASALPELPEGRRWRPLEHASIRSAMLDFLDTPRDIDPRRAVGDPAEELEWTFRVDIDARLAGTTVDNPTNEAGEPIYSAAQLGRDDSITVGFTSQLRADAASHSWGWENEGVARYRTTQTNTAPFAEGDDILSLRNTVAYRRFRSEAPYFYVPEPYLESYLESEFTQPDTRDYHHLLIRPTLGLRLKLTQHLTLKVGGGFSTELLDENRDVLPGLSAQLVLSSWTVMVQDTRKLTTEYTFDYFLTSQAQELRGRWDTTLDIAGPFQMVFGFQVFGRKEPEEDIGFAFDVTAGIRIAWLGRVGP